MSFSSPNKPPLLTLSKMERNRARVKITTAIVTILFFLSLSSSTVYSLKENPFTAKASAVRYWNKRISNKLPPPPFLLSKSSPLTAVESALFTKLAAKHALSAHLPAFCSAADLLCFPNSKPQEIKVQNHKSDSNFASYNNKNFNNYGTAHLGGADDFKNYSDGANFAASGFARYSRSSTGHSEGFSSYAPDGNVASANFSSYGGAASGGAGDFKTYMNRVNVPDLRFNSYDSEGNGHKLTFSSYADDTNSGNQGFNSYGKNGNGVPVDFASYGGTSNVVGSTFLGYGELGNSANDSFKAYTTNANNPVNNFRNYGGGVNAGTDTFDSYRDSANSGTDTFQSYGKDSNAERTNFLNYGKSFNVGVDAFKGYAKGAVEQNVGFKIYGVNTTFKDYAKKGVTFAGYTKPVDSDSNSNSARVSVKMVKRGVEEGKFFRESVLKEGKITKMPNVKDWMPKRSFLPRSISSKLPFSTEGLAELKRTFLADDNSTMEGVLRNALAECERAPSPGETKTCVGSIEDMVDFVVSVLGEDLTVRTTENVEGSSKDVMIGVVKGINGGRVTKSVSCHQSLYPYLLYYCHSVPKVRVYEADILEVETKTKINHGVAICHLDTSTWSPRHGAFVALGSGPGLIEVCHWIFENDMTWTRAD